MIKNNCPRCKKLKPSIFSLCDQCHVNVDHHELDNYDHEYNNFLMDNEVIEERFL